MIEDKQELKNHIRELYNKNKCFGTYKKNNVVCSIMCNDNDQLYCKKYTEVSRKKRGY